ncbi:hypothetical protein V8C26DRAFT_62079 [Trichoderma gracile]
MPAQPTQGEVPGGRGTAKRSDKVAEVRCLLEFRPEIRRAGKEERWKEGESNGSRRGNEIGRRTEEEEEGREITDRLRSVVYSRHHRREAVPRQAPISTARRQTGCNSSWGHCQGPPRLLFPSSINQPSAVALATKSQSQLPQTRPPEGQR